MAMRRLIVGCGVGKTIEHHHHPNHNHHSVTMSRIITTKASNRAAVHGAKQPVKETINKEEVEEENKEGKEKIEQKRKEVEHKVDSRMTEFTKSSRSSAPND